MRLDVLENQILSGELKSGLQTGQVWSGQVRSAGQVSCVLSARSSLLTRGLALLGRPPSPSNKMDHPLQVNLVFLANSEQVKLSQHTSDIVFKGGFHPIYTP